MTGQLVFFGTMELATLQESTDSVYFFTFTYSKSVMSVGGDKAALVALM